MKNKNVKDEKKEKKIGLTTKIFIALLLGAVFGIVLMRPFSWRSHLFSSLILTLL